MLDVHEIYGDKSWLHTRDVAIILGVSPKTVSRWAKDGKLRYLSTPGGHRRYPTVDILALYDDGLKEKGLKRDSGVELHGV